MEQPLYSTELGFSSPRQEEPPHSHVESSAPPSAIWHPDEPDTLPNLFARAVAAWPERIALTHGETSLSYRELDALSDALARRLNAAGIGAGDIVGLCLPRSPELIVALIAILKAGAAYLPLDPAYPTERLAFMTTDAEAALVIGTTATLGWLPAERKRIALDHLIGDMPAEALPCRAAMPDDLAYVIYTSGSTGRPKGVAVEHRCVTRLFSSTQHWFGFGPNDVWTLFHSVSFDFSVWEIFGALLHGGRLVVVPDETTRDPTAFLHLLHREEVTVLNQTPSAFHALDRADQDLNGHDPLHLRLVIFGGEALDPRRLAGWYMRRGEHAELVNMYGITETTVHVTYRPLHPCDCLTGGSPIGEPIPDLELLLLDGETLKPATDGETGEIFVAGAGLARGYLNRPELTAARFVRDPTRSDVRLYRSGDLARRLPDGGYEHLGRADQQVKIRGFRIECGEIEAALLEHDGIRQAAVALDTREGEPRLVAYVVTETGRPLRLSAMRRHLARSLPAHMVPDRFAQVSHLPLTLNGKLDLTALRAQEAILPQQAFLAPRDAGERELAATVAAVLRVDRLGLDDNFFDLGGNSLAMVELHRRLSPRAPSLALTDLYRYPNLRALSGRLKAAEPLPSPALAAAFARGARARSGRTITEARHE